MKAVLVVLFLLLNSSLLWAAKPKLIFAADPFCPYNCESAGSEQGALVDLLRAALEQDFDIEYRVMPWTRAVQEAKADRTAGVIAAAEITRKDLVLSQKPVAYSNQVYVTRANDAFEWNGIASIGARKGIFIKDYDYGTEIKKWIKDNPSQVEWLTGVDALPRSLKMIQASRADFIIANEAVLKFSLKNIPGAFDNLSINSNGNHVALYFGFSPKLNDKIKIVERFEAGFTLLKRNNKVEAIFAKYGLTPSY